jgi:hypothetical protein
MTAPAKGPAPSTRAGLSLVAFLAAAWLAALGARALSPALPGSAIGIADLIRSTRFAAACISQLVAAGGIALCVRLLGTVLPLPGLGVGLRMIAAPTTLAIVALVVSSATRPLEPELTFVLATALPLLLFAPVPLLLSARRTRFAAAVLLCVGVASLLDLLSLELTRRGADGAATSLRERAILFDVIAPVIAVASSAGRRFRIPIALAALLALALVPALLARGGGAANASGVEVLLYRSLEALRAPALAPAGVLEHVVALLPFAAGLVLFVLSLRGDELSVALALCLLGRTGPGAPIATLFGAGASLLVIRVFYVSFRDGSGAPRPARSNAILQPELSMTSSNSAK